MSNSQFKSWIHNAEFLKDRLVYHNKILALGGPKGPYRPRVYTDANGNTVTDTFCNRSATMFNRLSGINSSLLSSEQHSGPTVFNVNKNAFMANTMYRNLKRESNLIEGQVVKLPDSLAQLVSNNFSEVLAARRGTRHGHVAWVNPGHDPNHSDAPFITNIGVDVKIKPSHQSHNDFEYFTFRNSPFAHSLTGHLTLSLKSGQPLSSEALWLKNSLDTAYKELLPNYSGKISDTTDFLNRTVFDQYRKETQISTITRYFPHSFTSLCREMNFDVNKIKPPHW